MSSPPAYGMGSAQRSSLVAGENFAKVGPGSYEKHLNDKKKAPVLTMGMKLKDQITSDKQSPGANAYNIPSKIVESPAKSIGARLSPDESNQGKLGIGPGGYNITSPKKNSYAYSFAGRLEDIEKKKRGFVPGPGLYEAK